jgi:multiple sugar transport system ATP-binding protein
LSNLDAKLRVQMRTEVSRLQKRLGTTTVYVTHDQTEAMTLGDRVAVMRGGKIQQVGPPQELYNHPNNLFVAGFIGSPAMNFMPAKLEEGKLRTKLGDIELSDSMRRTLEQKGGSREVILGIRPENFEDAALVPADIRSHGVVFPASIDVLESMGSEVFAYFTLEDEGGPAQSAELEELARDSGRADTGSDSDQIVARLDPATAVKEGEPSDMWVDTRKIHVFDPGSGENLTRDPGDTAHAGAGAATTPS